MKTILNLLLRPFNSKDVGKTGVFRLRFSLEGHVTTTHIQNNNQSRGQVIAMVISFVVVIFAMSIGTSRADTYPTMHVSGMLSASETWTSNYIYVVDSQLTVPNGITLTIDPGTIVKYKTGSGYASI
jgi:hypothetical protein